MKVIKHSIITILFFLLFAPIALLAQGYVNLSQTRDISEYPFIIIRSNGEILVTWSDYGHPNGNSSIWYKTYTESNGWSGMKQAAAASAAFPQLALDNSGNVHMAFWSGAGSGARDIYYKKYRNGSWSGKELVYYSPGLNSAWQRINVEGSKISVLWCHNYARPTPQDVVFIQKTDGGKWPSNYVNVSGHPKKTSIHPFLKVKNSNVYAVWMDDYHALNNWNIYFAERKSGYWSSPLRLSPGPNQYAPAVEVDNNGNVHVIYSGRGGPIYYLKRTGSKWSSPKVISTAGTSITTFNYMKFANGLLHAVWRQRIGENEYIYYSRATPSGNWEAPLKVSQGTYAHYPCLDVDKNGKIHVVYSDIGVGSERDVFYIRLDHVTSYPVASFTASPVQGDPPLYVNFDASTSFDPDGKIVSYQWTFGDGSSGSGIKTSHTYTTRGMHSASLTVTDDDGQTSTSTKEIMVGSPPIANFAANPTSGGAPLTVHFDASASYDSDGNITSYHWDFGDGGTGSGITTNHTYTQLNTYTATLTVRDNEGLEAQKSVNIKVSTGPIAQFTCTPTNGTIPLVVSFDASDSKPSNQQSGEIVKYQWDFGDEIQAQGVKVKHTYQKVGVFTVTLKVTDNQGKTDTATKDITAYHKPVAKFTCYPEGGIAPIEISFDASASYDEDGHIHTYKWLFGDGGVGWRKTTKHTYTTGGDITISLTVIDNNGWSDTATKTIKIIDKPYPPLNLTVQKIINRGVYFADFINVLEWEKNPKNTGKIAVVKYLIFKKVKGSVNPDFIYQGTVDASTIKFEDSSPTSESEMNNIIYGIKAVDISGRESDMATIDSGTS